MSRDDGFPVADIDSSYLEDAKVRALWQLLRDEGVMARALLLHTAVVLSSWRHGERVTAEQAAPLWLTVTPEILDALRTVKLLDKSGRIVNGSWSRWFGAAANRRSIKREAGRLGGLASVKGRSSGASAQVEQPSSDAEPVRPSVPPVRPPVPTEGERDVVGGNGARGPRLVDPPSLSRLPR